MPSPRRRWLLFRLVAVAAAIAVAPGCGPGDVTPGVAVSGIVRYQGKPIPSGYIIFAPETETASRAASAKISDGYYSIPAATGPLKGKFHIEVTADDPKPGSPNPVIPEVYNLKSTLSITIPDRKAFEYHLDLK